MSHTLVEDLYAEAARLDTKGDPRALPSMGSPARIAYNEAAMIIRRTLKQHGPYRMQQHRSRGWRKPDHTVIVSRPSRWGNPFAIDDSGTYCTVFERTNPSLLWRWGNQSGGDREWAHRAAVGLFEHWLEGRWPTVEPSTRQRILAELPLLAGLNLACWCPPHLPCHSDVLLRWANRDASALR